MKDIRGREINVGDHVLYIRSISDRNFEEGIVVVCRDDFIRIDYMGVGNGSSATKTRRGTVTATNKKVIVMSLPVTDTEQLDRFNQERVQFKDEVKRVENKLAKSLEREKKLQANIDLLQAEANKIHSRWDILDLQ